MGNYRFDALLFTCNLIVASFPSCRVRQLFYRKVMNLDLAPGVRILSGLWLDCRGHLTIGKNTVVNQRCRLDARGTIFIGANVSISPEVHLLTADHNLKSDSLEGKVREIRIEDYVFIGSRALVLPGVKIGKGAAVGAGAVVTRDVEEFTVVAGSPARIIGTRPKNLKYDTFYERHFF